MKQRKEEIKLFINISVVFLNIYINAYLSYLLKYDI